MASHSVESELSALKDKAIKASAANDRDFYDSYLADDAVAILPVGRLDKQQVLASMTGDKAPFSAKRIEDTRITPLGEDAGMVTYRAIYENQDGEYAVAATTVYEKRDGAWKGVLYQQTVLQ